MKNREMIGSMTICDLLLKINMETDTCVLDAFTDDIDCDSQKCCRDCIQEWLNEEVKK